VQGRLSLKARTRYIAPMDCRRYLFLGFGLSIMFLGCGSDDHGSNAPPVDLATLGIDAATLERCDPMGAECMLPFPNDHFTVADPSAPTGRRLAIVRESLPINRRGFHIDPTDQNRGDGFSPGSTIVIRFAGLDAQASNIPSLVDAEGSLDEDSPIVILDATTGERQPFWADIDVLGEEGEEPLVLMHPSINFADGHRIVVAVRRLVDESGAEIPAPAAFAAYRDGVLTTDDTFERRRESMERIFAELEDAGVGRDDLQLAWEFTVASTESLTGRMIAIRDDAFAALGDAAPVYRIDSVVENPNADVRRQVSGTFDVPLYLTNGGEPRSRLVLDDNNGKPLRQPGTFTAGFLCNLPPASAQAPARMSLYGHGLLGSRRQVNGGLTRRMAAVYNIAYCATDWYGMNEDDVQAAIAALADLSNFAAIPDRCHQGFLAFLFLGRLMKHPDGFSANDAFRFGDQPALKIDELYYDGNSQGAILGGALTAVAQDFTRAVLGEAGMNYSILLDRSIDFDQYLEIVMKPSYPRRYDRVIGGLLAQLLWDRSETNGYANHITRDPLPGTPVHHVLLLGSVGDQQVSEYSLRVQAATMGVPAHLPLAAPGRVAEIDPAWLLEPIPSYPHAGSAYYLWDTGAVPSPLENMPPREGRDPHDDPPKIPEVQKIKDEFWRPVGAIEDACGAGPCTAPVPQ
jgi:hypothetical protein